jgi:acetyltransferase-like isoleucine patch superfamily enzyme
MKRFLHRLSVVTCGIPKMALKFSKEEGRSPLWFVCDFLRNYRKAGIMFQDYVDARSSVEVGSRDRNVAELASRKCYFRTWRKDYFKRAKFLSKFSVIGSESTPYKRAKRVANYKKFFGLGDGCWVGHNVIFTKVHPSDGVLKVGKNVIFSRNQDIDFTGGVEVGDGVLFAEGVKIITHEHDHYKLRKDERILPGPDRTYKCPLRIGSKARLGAHCIIMPTVGEIGEGAVIGVGEIVRRAVPPYNMVRNGKMVEIIH